MQQKNNVPFLISQKVSFASFFTISKFEYCVLQFLEDNVQNDVELREFIYLIIPYVSPGNTSGYFIVKMNLSSSPSFNPSTTVNPPIKSSGTPSNSDLENS